MTIPYQADTEPLASQRVFLSHEQFRELYRLANPDKSELSTAPHAGGIVEAFYVAKLVPNTLAPEDSVIEVKARYAVRSFVNRQLVVDLPISGVSAREAMLDGRAAALITRGHGFQVAIVESGMHVLDLTFDLPARLSGAVGSFSVPLTPVAAGKLSFQLPAKDLSIRVNGSSTIYRRVTQEGTQSIELPIDKGGDLAITWQPEQFARCDRRSRPSGFSSGGHVDGRGMCPQSGHELSNSTRGCRGYLSSHARNTATAIGQRS